MNFVLFSVFVRSGQVEGALLARIPPVLSYTYQVAMQEIPTKILPVAELETERLPLSDLSPDTNSRSKEISAFVPLSAAEKVWAEMHEVYEAEWDWDAFDEAFRMPPIESRKVEVNITAIRKMGVRIVS